MASKFVPPSWAKPVSGDEVVRPGPAKFTPPPFARPVPVGTESEPIIANTDEEAPRAGDNITAASSAADALDMGKRARALVEALKGHRLTVDADTGASKALDMSNQPFGERLSNYAPNLEAVRTYTHKVEKDRPIPAAAGSLAVTAPLAAASWPVVLTAGAVMGGAKSTANPFSDPGRFALDVGGETLVSGAGKLGGEALTKYGAKAIGRGGAALKNSKFGGFIEGKIGAAKAAQLELEEAAKKEAIESGRGTIGGATSSANRNIELLTKALESDDPEVVANAKTILESPENRELLNAIYRNAIEQHSTKMTAIKAGRELLETAKQIDPAKRAEEALAHPIKTQILPRARTYAERAIPMAVGSAIGGPAGTVAGTAVANALGRPTTVAAKAMQSPAVRNMMWTALQKTIIDAPERLGKYGAVFASAAGRGGTPAALAMHDALLSSDPDYAAKLIGLAEEDTQMSLAR